VAGPARWRRPEDVRQTGLIGPNAVLQLLPLLQRAGIHDQIMAEAGIFAPPAATGLMPEGPAARLHQALRAAAPDLAPALAWAAGTGTADYIRRYRIPHMAQWVLRALPDRSAAHLLSAAIARHAWTFAGSGRFAVTAPLVFEIADNPIVRGEESATPLCHWHRAVFERLFRALVHDSYRCAETECCAMGDPACRFVLTRV
jgi:divinyl protochlorophyllide a 8-vinyl-reductase